MPATPKDEAPKAETRGQAVPPPAQPAIGSNPPPAQGSGAVTQPDGSLPGVQMIELPVDPDVSPPHGPRFAQVLPGEEAPEQ